MEQALIVESNLISRRQIVADLSSHNIAQMIIEAKSVSHGLSVMKTVRIDGCFLGPRLKRERAISFIREGRSLSNSNKSCAYIAVVDDSEADPAEFLAAGAHSAVVHPYSLDTLIHGVHSAVEQSLVERTSDPLIIAAKRLSQQRAGQVPDILRALAADLSLIASDISANNLSLHGNGQPSLAIRDSIRLALEKAFYGSAFEASIGTDANLLVNSVVSWFCDRTTNSLKESMGLLERRLARPLARR